MDWTKFQTYGDSNTKAFETLCNQLFENWCYEEYGENIKSFQVVNGAGGDGGVESFAILNDDKIIGLQAKWFRESMNSSQINQIKKSIDTALKIRSKISKYIVCVPRNLTSLTGKGNNSEDKKWNDLVKTIKNKYPDLQLELWNDFRIDKELHKEYSVGILKFWFKNSEISEEKIKNNFEASKSSWLESKYEPKLSQLGVINNYLCQLLGNIDERLHIYTVLNKALTLINAFNNAVEELSNICKEKDEVLFSELFKLQNDFIKLEIAAIKVLEWIKSESTLKLNINEYDFIFNCEIVEDLLKESKIRYKFQYHCYDVEKIVRRIEYLSIFEEVSKFKDSLSRNSIVFLGEPGTGKTNGLASVAQKLIDENIHIPIVIQAKSISTYISWKDIMISCLGLSHDWDEAEIWQALCSLANRKKIKIFNSNSAVNILPKVLIMVDAIDETSDYEYWGNKLKESTFITKNYPQIRFCFTSRPHAVDRNMNNANFYSLPHTGDVPCYQLFDAYMDEYHIKIKDAEWLRYSLNTPLTLKLFCEIYKNQTIFADDNISSSFDELIKKKIALIESEFSKYTKISADNQYVLELIKLLSIKFIERAELERAGLIDLTIEKLKTDRCIAEKLLEYLEKYGVLGKVVYKQRSLWAKDKIVYYIGIQGYFDYVIALMLLEKYRHPKDIIFDKTINIPHNTFYILSIIAIQQYDYLITQNKSLGKIIDGQLFDELTFYSLRNSKRDDAIKYVEMVKSYMSHNTESLIATTNRLILPLSRNILHPLGVKLLHNYLSSFKFPAQRDLIWSVPVIKKGYGDRYYDSGQKVDLDEQAYKLSELDVADGCPTIYAWVLSNVDNDKREYARTELMRWALLSPKEFFKLLVKFVNINDLQIKSDLFSILMCLIFESADRPFKQQVTEWILSNILSKNKIDLNRNIAIRYYCISILKKSIVEGIIDEKAKKYLPPYKVKNYTIKLSKEALAGTRMSGYKGITYDLSRYVLIDHIDSYFNSFNLRQKNQFEKLLNKIAEQQPEYSEISEEQFILSAAFQFITDYGWNEKEFDFYELDGNISRGVDCLIRGVYYPATHGSQSQVMTICEKYVWQARSEIMGFLADRIKMENDNKTSYVKNYEILENYVIPMRNLEGIKAFSDDYCYLPEKDKLSINKKIITKDELITGIKSMPNIDWGKWIFVNNAERKYKIESDTLIALNSYTSIDSENYMDTVIAIETLIVPKCNFQKLITRIADNEISISAPSDFEADLDINCYISPKELCWFPWIKQFNDFIFDDKQDLSLIPTTVKCCADIGEDGETVFYIPSKEIRKILGIVRSDNYLFFDANDDVKAEYYFIGDKYETHQEYLFVDKAELLKKANERGYELVWLLKEYRREDMKAKEKFGRFYTEKEICSIGYLVNGELKIITISNENKI